ncbi:hypothetical protein B566_EDAN012976 [Ephemera danica]|nr:hypothetical protein B566_EDAN012976 [Ephemera danica]
MWRNYCSSARADVAMTVTVSAAGLRAVTREHGLTEYWSHRVTFCAAPAAFPRVFCWVYRHEGRRLKQELRCHAVLCSKASVARTMAAQLQSRLGEALREFRRDKLGRQQARLSLANSVYAQPTLPRRRIMLSTGSANYRPPLERCKSAPKLGPIDEISEEELVEQEEEEDEEEEEGTTAGGSLSSESGVVVATAPDDESHSTHEESGDESGFDEDAPPSKCVDSDDSAPTSVEDADLLTSVLSCMASPGLQLLPGATTDSSYVEV